MSTAKFASTIEEPLLPEHLAMLREGSGLPDDVILERGYRSVTSISELRRLGFTDRQARTPALLIPLHDVHRELVGHSARPDEPRIADGKPIKYEMPKGWRQRLDVPQRCQSMLGDPSITLYITEGAKKADALAARGACTVSLNGVWSWRAARSSERLRLPAYRLSDSTTSGTPRRRSCLRRASRCVWLRRCSATAR